MSCPVIRQTEMCRWMKRMSRLRNLHLLRRCHLSFPNQIQRNEKPLFLRPSNPEHCLNLLCHHYHLHYRSRPRSPTPVVEHVIPERVVTHIPSMAMGRRELASHSSHSHSWEDYAPLPPTKLWSHREKSSSVHRLPQKDDEIRDTSPTMANANSKPISVPPRAPPPVVSSTEPPTPAVLPPRPNLLHPHSTARLPLYPAVAPLTGCGHSTWTRQEVGIASHSSFIRNLTLHLSLNPLRLLDR